MTTHGDIEYLREQARHDMAEIASLGADVEYLWSLVVEARSVIQHHCACDTFEARAWAERVSDYEKTRPSNAVGPR